MQMGSATNCRYSAKAAGDAGCGHPGCVSRLRCTIQAAHGRARLAQHTGPERGRKQCQERQVCMLFSNSPHAVAKRAGVRRSPALAVGMPAAGSRRPETRMLVGRRRCCPRSPRHTPPLRVSWAPPDKHIQTHTWVLFLIHGALEPLRAGVCLAQRLHQLAAQGDVGVPGKPRRALKRAWRDEVPLQGRWRCSAAPRRHWVWVRVLSHADTAATPAPRQGGPPIGLFEEAGARQGKGGGSTTTHHHVLGRL